MTSSSSDFSPNPKKNRVSEFSAEPSSLARIFTSMRTTFVSKRNAAWLRTATVAVLLLATSSGCFADVQFEPTESASTGGTAAETSGDPGESGSTSEAGTTSGTLETTTGEVAGSSDDGTTAVPDDSTTTTASDEESSSEGSSSTGDPVTMAWDQSCAWTSVPAEVCSGKVDAPSNCTLPVSQFDAAPICGQPAFSRIEVPLAADDYVVGTLSAAAPMLSVLTFDRALVTCESGLATFSLAQTETVALDVRTEAGYQPSVLIRAESELCSIRNTECCAPSGSAGTDACGDDGLRACVEAADPYCAKAWDSICVTEATLLCGADCV